MEDAHRHHPAGTGPDVLRPHAHGGVPRQGMGKAFGGDPLRDLAPGLDRSPIGLIVTGELRRRQPLLGQPGNSGALHLLLPGPHSHHRPAAPHPRRQGRGGLRTGAAVHAAARLGLRRDLPQPLRAELFAAECGQGHRYRPAGPRSIKDAQPPKTAKKATGKKVAIIGGGPAGMNVAWQLAREGIEAHIFEKGQELGGKLAQVIPWERLPKAVWEEEIARFMINGQHQGQFRRTI